MTAEYRTEADLLVSVKISNERLFGVNTERAVANFPVGTGKRLGDYPSLVRSMLQVKLACTTTNRYLGRSRQHISGDAPTKEVPLHAAMYDARTTSGAIVHFHSTRSVAVSMLPDLYPDDVLPALTAYNLMRIGKTALVPYHRPGDPAVSDAIRGLGGRYSSVLLSNHGPVVSGDSIEKAVWAMEELEETARFHLLLSGLSPRLLTSDEVCELKNL